jgi:hypothetical protein
MVTNEEHVRIWLRQSRALAILLVKRVEMYQDLCPKISHGMNPDDRAALEKSLININEEIRQHASPLAPEQSY